MCILFFTNLPLPHACSLLMFSSPLSVDTATDTIMCHIWLRSRLCSCGVYEITHTDTTEKNSPGPVHYVCKWGTYSCLCFCPSSAAAPACTAAPWEGRRATPPPTPPPTQATWMPTWFIRMTMMGGVRRSLSQSCLCRALIAPGEGGCQGVIQLWCPNRLRAVSMRGISVWCVC